MSLIAIFRPINTYGGQATLKPKLPERQQHAIIYTSEQVPEELSYKAPDGTIMRECLVKSPIKVIPERVDADGQFYSLHPASRINYSKIYTVENYVRVLNIGKVDKNSHQSFLDDSMLSTLLRPSERPEKQPAKGRKRSRNEKGMSNSKSSMTVGT
jgi:hypothetical protein